MVLNNTQSPTVKSPREIDLMRKAGHIVADTLNILRDAAKPGMTSAQLDEIAGREIRGRGGVPSFLGYQGFPAHICTSFNTEVFMVFPAPGKSGTGTFCPSTAERYTTAITVIPQSHSRLAIFLIR